MECCFQTPRNVRSSLLVLLQLLRWIHLSLVDSDTINLDLLDHIEIYLTNRLSSFVETEVSSLSSHSLPLADSLLVSDLSAARAADLLFVRIVDGHTNDLFVHCERENIPHVTFKGFLEVRDSVAEVVEGRKSVKEILETK